MTMASDNFAGGCSTFRFDSKPGAAVRETLKSYRYRWSPSSGHWYAYRATIASHEAVRRAVELAENGGGCQVERGHGYDTDADYEEACREACGL
jgi:hypothetical protein